MHLYSDLKNLSSYTVDKQFIESIETYITSRIPSIFYEGEDFTKCIIVTTHYSKSEESGTTIKIDSAKMFNDGVIAISIAMDYFDTWTRKGISIKISFKKRRKDCNLSIAVHDNAPHEKVYAIQKGLLSTLNHNRNLNSLIYPIGMLSSLLIVPFLSLLIFAIINQDKRYLLISILSIATIALYLLAFRYVKGYCSFESNRQKRLDKTFNWFTLAIAGFVLSSILFILRKELFGF